MHKHEKQLVYANTNGLVIKCMFLTIKPYSLHHHHKSCVTIAHKITMIFIVFTKLVFKCEQSYSG